MLVRPARRDDADAIFGLLGQLASTFTPDRGAFDTTIDEYFAAPEADGILLVGEDDGGAVVAYAFATFARLLYTNGPAAQLQELVVDESARGRDLGTMLVRALEQECMDRGVTQLTVASRRAGGFYDRLGYSATAEYLKRTF